MRQVGAVWFGFCLFAVGGEASRANGMQLTSTAFTEGQSIPAKYTCVDQNVSPALKWTGVPAGTKALVLIVDDPDAPVGTWVHWVLYDLPGDVIELQENVSKDPALPNGAKQGLNDFGETGYGGPCPPPGKPHRYFFKLYALDSALGLKPGASKKEVERAMGKHVVGQAELMGRFGR
jgi:Raf kinase inhibitor-like YbhB/YbcL family protein